MKLSVKKNEKKIKCIVEPCDQVQKNPGFNKKNIYSLYYRLKPVSKLMNFSELKSEIKRPFGMIKIPK